jgi:hypothetical protein
MRLLKPTASREEWTVSVIHAITEVYEV